MNILGILLSTFAFASPVHIEHDSNIFGPPYHQVIAAQKQLEALHPQWVHIRTYGYSVEQNPLVVVEIFNPEKKSYLGYTPTVLTSGATHGNEYLGFEDRLSAWFVEQGQSTISNGVKDFLDLGGHIFVIPIFNPDGYQARDRENKKGTDLNRDFPSPAGNTETSFPLSSPEVRYWVKFLSENLHNQQRKFLLAIDYHCCAPGLIRSWAYTDEKPPESGLEKMRRYGELYVSTLNVPLGDSAEIMGYNSTGTSKDFYFSMFGAISYTYEGSRTSEKDNYPKHQFSWNLILHELAREISQPIYLRYGLRN